MVVLFARPLFSRRALWGQAVIDGLIERLHHPLQRADDRLADGRAHDGAMASAITWGLRRTELVSAL